MTERKDFERVCWEFGKRGQMICKLIRQGEGRIQLNTPAQYKFRSKHTRLEYA